MWTAPWQELSDVLHLVGCGHVSGLLVRQVWPLALMLCADRVPKQTGALWKWCVDPSVPLAGPQNFARFLP